MNARPGKISALGQTHQIIVGLALALVVVLALEAFEFGIHFDLDGAGWNSRLHIDNDGNWRLEQRRGRERLKVRSQGEVVIANDERSVESMGPNAELSIDHRHPDEPRRRLTVQPSGSGEIEYRYTVDGDEATFDNDARDWFQDSMLRVYRRGGLDAEGRAERIYAARGTAGVLDEVGHIGSDSIARIYLQSLVAREGMEKEELADVLRSGAKSLGSDYELAQLLTSLPTEALADEVVLDAFAAATRYVGSDHFLGFSLDHHLEVVKEPKGFESFLEISEGLGSDHHLAEFLVASAAEATVDRPFPRALGSAMGSLSSDYNLSRSIVAFLERGTISADNRQKLLEAASSIGSDHTMAELLVTYADYHPNGEPLPNPIFERLASIGSDFDQARTIGALVAVGSSGDLPELVRSARNIGTDHSLSELLIQIARTEPLSPTALEAFEQTSRAIGHEFLREQVESALAEATLSEREGEATAAAAEGSPVKTEEASMDGPRETTTAPEDPAAADPAVEDPAVEDPGAEDPGTSDPGAEDPAAEDRTAEDPAAEDPAGDPSGVP